MNSTLNTLRKIEPKIDFNILWILRFIEAPILTINKFLLKHIYFFIDPFF